MRPIFFILALVVGFSSLASLECGWDGDVAGTPMQRLDSQVNFQPAWSANGDFIVTYTDYRIHGVAADGSDFWSTKKHRKDFQTSPAMSADGRLAFNQLRVGDENSSWQIQLADVDIDDAGKVESVESALGNHPPIWSSNGNLIAKASRGFGWLGLHVMDRDGNLVNNVMIDPSDFEFTERVRTWHITQIAWSPDDTRIAVLVRVRFNTETDYAGKYGSRNKLGSALLIVSANDADSQTIMRTTDDLTTALAWDPKDNRLIYIHTPESVFYSCQSPECEDQFASLRSMKPDGNDRQVLAILDDRRYEALSPNRGASLLREEIQISEDGRVLLLARSDADLPHHHMGQTSLHLIGSERSTPKFITRLDSDAAFASWSPDGSRIALATPHNEKVLLRTILPDGTDSRVLLERGDNGKIKPGLGRPLTDGKQ